MTLKNLLGISLDVIPPDKALAAKLLAAAQRNIADAQLQGLSVENRFDAAYKAIMQSSMVALHANGYRTLTSKPGHHQNGDSDTADERRLAAIQGDRARRAAQAAQSVRLFRRLDRRLRR